MTALESLVQQIDKIDITGYPVDEQKVLEKCDLISKGVEILSVNISEEPMNKVRDFIKRIYWFGLEIGSNKALEMSEYVEKQSGFLKKAIQLGRQAFLGHESEILLYLKLLQSSEQDQARKKELQEEIIKIESI